MTIRRPRNAQAAACRGIVVGIGLLLAGCHSSSAPTEKAIVPTPVNPATAGRIQVEVRYAETVPTPKAFDMRSAPRCAAAHPTPAYDQSLLVQEGRVANAVVWIKQGLEHWAFAPPATPVVIDQKGCLYAPHVAAAMVGQPVEFRNSDSAAHNIHAHPHVVPAWNFMLGRKGASRTLSCDRPEVAIPIGCDIHPWMRGYLAVVANPYFAVTPADGSVTLRQVPPGSYVVAAWHEKLGTREQHVTLPPKGTVTVRLQYGPAPRSP
ncbi:MAG: carboxypeptidase regulatory-like domain-containing protein [Candidatus Binatia bacterium]